jgi:hypothetical protein
MNLDDLQKSRPVIVKMLQKVTDGEINDFDFIVDFLSHNRGGAKVTFLFGIPGRVKKDYEGNTDEIIDKHLDSIYSVLSTAGFPEVTKRSISYQVL